MADWEVKRDNKGVLGLILAKEKDPKNVGFSELAKAVGSLGTEVNEVCKIE